jgi:transposase
MENLEIRALLRHYWKQNSKATEAAKKICEMEGEGVISNCTAQNWFRRFSDGDTSLEDEPRSGSPVTVDSEALREAVGANPANQQSPIVR